MMVEFLANDETEPYCRRILVDPLQVEVIEEYGEKDLAYIQTRSGYGVYVRDWQRAWRLISELRGVYTGR